MTERGIVAALIAAALLASVGCGRRNSSKPVDQQQAGTVKLNPDERPAQPQPTSTEPTPESVAVVPAPAAADSEAVPSETLFGAALEGEISIVRKALGAGTAVDVRDGEQRTALMLASFNGHADVVGMLLDAGADVNLCDRLGRTALMFAATAENIDTVNLLLSAGAHVNPADGHEGWTALMFAAAEGQEVVVSALLKHGANPKTRDGDGDNAADFAAQRGHTELAALLRKAEGAAVSEKE